MRKEIYNKWLEEQLIFAQEKERCRISKDLHDSVSQELYMVKMYLNSLKSLEYNSEAYNKAILEMGNLLSDAVVSIREISHDLSPQFIEKHIFSKSIQCLLEKYQNQDDLKIVFICETDMSLPTKTMELHVYRIAQEFIHNSIKHSGAKTLTVELKHTNGCAQILLSDDGKGFDISGQYNSIGLANIEMRMKTIGAKYSYFSVPNSGTDLKITIDEKCS